MFCPNCGCWNPDDSQNCSACATSLKAAPAAPANAVNTGNGFADRWRKIVTSPLLLILAAIITIQAIMSFEVLFDLIGYSFDMLSYEFLIGLLMLIVAASQVAVFVIAAGMWLGFVDGIQKDKPAFGTTGLSLIHAGVVVQLLSFAVVALCALIGLGEVGGLGIIGSDNIVIMFLTLIIYIGYYATMMVTAKHAKNAVITKMPSTGGVSGAIVMCAALGVLTLIGMIDSDAFGFTNILGLASYVVQVLLLVQYKNEMSK